MKPQSPLADPDVLEPDLDPQELARVEELVRTLGKTVRAHQLYEGSSPVYDRFVEVLRRTFAALWSETDLLALEVEENRVLWRRHEVYHSTQRSDNISFLFYRDGIRELVFQPGFEASELDVFLSLLARVHRVRDDQDDLVTLLWERDFSHLTYRHVDFAVDGVEIPASSGTGVHPVDPRLVRDEVAKTSAEALASGPRAANEPVAYELPVTLRDTLYFLEESELRLIRDELHRELSRSLLRDVLNGLFDRMEDGDPQRQQRIVRILTELLPGLISGGRIAESALLLRELAQLASREPPLERPVLLEIRSLFEQLAEPVTVEELLRTVEDDPTAMDADQFATLLGYFPPRALAPLIVGAESAERAEVRERIVSVIERLAAHDPQHLVRLVDDANPLLAAGAARLVGRIALKEAAPDVARLLERPEPAVRLAAVTALQELRAASAAGALQNVLADRNRDVRIAAARALGALRFSPARARLEALVASRSLRDADVTERIAVFEAYGSVAGAEGIPLLNRLLNGRRWWRRTRPEIRACAALALGRIDEPEARAALQRAARDPDPIVRTAVSRGLRQEAW